MKFDGQWKLGMALQRLQHVTFFRRLIMVAAAPWRTRMTSSTPATHHPPPLTPTVPSSLRRWHRRKWAVAVIRRVWAVNILAVRARTTPPRLWMSICCKLNEIDQNKRWPSSLFYTVHIEQRIHNLEHDIQIWFDHRLNLKIQPYFYNFFHANMIFKLHAFWIMSVSCE